jgi:hypothetical protein
MMAQVVASLSSSGLSRGSTFRPAPARADGWMVGTSPTMTTNRMQKLIGISLEGSVG